MIIFDYDVECIDKITREVIFTVPVATTSYPKAKQIASTWLETVKGVPSIDYVMFVKRVYPGREGVIITEELLASYQEEKEGER